MIRSFDDFLFKFNNKEIGDSEHKLNLSMYLYLQILSLMLIYSRTSFKIELLTNVEVLHYTEAKDFFHRITHLNGMYSFLCSMAPH